MNAEDLRDILRTRPFIPFRLYLTDGSSYDVRHPEMLIVFRRIAVLALGEPAEGVYERPVTISLVHIVRVEPVETAQTGDQG